MFAYLSWNSCRTACGGKWLLFFDDRTRHSCQWDNAGILREKLSRPSTRIGLSGRSNSVFSMVIFSRSSWFFDGRIWIRWTNDGVFVSAWSWRKQMRNGHGMNTRHQPHWSFSLSTKQTKVNEMKKQHPSTFSFEWKTCGASYFVNDSGMCTSRDRSEQNERKNRERILAKNMIDEWPATILLT